MSVELSDNYQVVIPKAVREAFNLTPGMEIDVIAKGGLAYLVPVHSLKSIRERISPFVNSPSLNSARDKKDRKVLR